MTTKTYEFNYETAKKTLSHQSDIYDRLVQSADIQVLFVPGGGSDEATILNCVQNLPAEMLVKLYADFKLGHRDTLDIPFKTVVFNQIDPVKLTNITKHLPESLQPLAPTLTGAQLIQLTLKNESSEYFNQIYLVLAYDESKRLPVDELSKSQADLWMDLQESDLLNGDVAMANWHYNEKGNVDLKSARSNQYPLINRSNLNGAYKAIAREFAEDQIYEVADDLVHQFPDFNWDSAIFDQKVSDVEYAAQLQFGDPLIVSQLSKIIDLFASIANSRKFNVYCQLLATDRLKQLMAYALSHQTQVDVADLFVSKIPASIIISQFTPNLHLKKLSLAQPRQTI